MMNKTEITAMEWLIKKKGYKLDQISFNSMRSPDFICNDGIQYEVKRMKNNQIFFTARQKNNLDEGCIILIFKDGDKNPFMQVPFKKVKKVPCKHKGLTFRTLCNSTCDPKTKTKILYMDTEVQGILKKYIKKYKMSGHDIIIEIIKKFSEVEKANGSSIDSFRRKA